MKTDDVRLHYTYGGGLLVIVLGFALVFLKIDEIPSEALIALVSGVFGLVLGFFFNRESSAGQARATERAIAQGADTANTSPTTTTISQ